MKGFVDKDACIGCGLCTAMCPKVFKMDKGGKAEAIEDEIDENLIADVRDAEAGCPVAAITIE